MNNWRYTDNITLLTKNKGRYGTTVKESQKRKSNNGIRIEHEEEDNINESVRE